MKNLQFFENFKEILRFFPIFFKFYRIFRENLGKTLEICICRGFEGRANLLKTVEKSMETGSFW